MLSAVADEFADQIKLRALRKLDQSSSPFVFTSERGAP
jgi:hypothetical protein